MYILRNASQADIPTLKNLYRYFVDEMSGFDSDDSNSDEEIMSWIETSLNENNGVIVVAENDQGIHGFARVSRKTRVAENEGNIINYAKLNDLYVLSQYRKQGIASLLINSAIEWTKNKSLSRIILNVYENNNPARTLYESKGFVTDCHISNNRIRMKHNLQNSK